MCRDDRASNHSHLSDRGGVGASVDRVFCSPKVCRDSRLALLLFLLIVAYDAWFRQPRLAALRASLPDVIRFSKGRDGTIDLKIENNTPHAVRFRMGFPFPAEIGAALTEFDASVPGSSAQLFSIQCQPKQRGRFLLSKFYVEAPSRLRLWNIRHVLPLKSELRVYPDLLSARRNISALFLPHGRFGFRQHRQVGKGREFEKLRDYIPGDGAEDIHWKATAKRGRPVTKVFQIERTQEVYIIIDSSRLSARWSGEMAILERFINSALILCLAAARQSDLFGLVTFNDKVQKFIRAKNGKHHYDVCRDALYTLQAEKVTPDFKDLFTFLRLRLRRRALLIFLTSLDDPVLGSQFVEHIDLLTRQHLVMVNMIQPVEARPLFSGDDVTEASEIYRRLGGHLLWAELQEVRKRLQRLGVQLALARSDQFAAEAVNRYFRIKQRQVL